jgi:ketosteroid isomerase-like protein
MTPSSQTTEEREVWETLRNLNDAWTEADGRNLGDYFHKDMVAITPTDRYRREGRDECIAGWLGFLSVARVHYLEELDPEIHVYGNTAVVTYYFDMEFETGGQTVKMGGRDMFVFVKEDGKWWAVADHYSPYPQ